MSEWKLHNSIGATLIDKLLHIRGISEDDRESFLFPDYEAQTHDPMLFKDMGIATDRLKKAIDNDEHIVVFGDYDADGTCGTVVFTDFLRKIEFTNFEIYLPDRYNEGYGLKQKHVEAFIKNNAKLLITIDCGVTSLDEIKYAKEHDLETIVLDHHIVPPVWPEAIAIINPKRPGEKYPYQHICGTGLSFKFVSAMIQRFDFDIPEGWEKWLLDAVAIATVADMVPLTGENRVLLRYGIKVLKKTRRLGLKELYKKAKLNTRFFQTDDIGFMIAPRINAASRLAHASLSYRLLTTIDSKEARDLAKELDELNASRKILVEEMMKEAHDEIAQMKEIPELLFIGRVGWNPGVLGILANRLLDTYHRPAFVWGGGEKDRKGSCRGGDEVNVVELMRSCEKLFTNMGGHAAAGGFAFDGKNTEKIGKELNAAFLKMEKGAQAPPLVFDAELAMEDVAEQVLQDLKKLEPFGMDNTKPLFLFPAVKPIELEAFGKNGGGHVRARFRTERGSFITAIGFGLGDHIPELHKAGVPIDVAGHIEENYFAGRRELRLRIVAMRKPKDCQVFEIAKTK